jgi:hypothetical protein
VPYVYTRSCAGSVVGALIGDALGIAWRGRKLPTSRRLLSLFLKKILSIASIDTAWTPGALHERDIFQGGGNDAGVKASASTDVCLAPVNRSDDLPCPRMAGECYEVILLDSRSYCRFLPGRRRSRAFPPDAALRGAEGDAGEDRVTRRDGYGTSVRAGFRTFGA